ncbi:hypothetical protein [Sinorhizobium sp. BG8]|uniref:hypothetical protein n=1 Tax=Sinorhizobium sp. BG8 TaxID=2613773 RepID=UPI00193DD1AB|nr:hypothetical protein [Sinorhizobium sp. BG8]QRM53604.1 hypothetical protein F3Y30_02775 [Sinorhizobium sp. BG8]
MQSVRSVFLTTAAILIAGSALVFAASVGIAIAGVLAVTMIGSAIAAKFQPKPVRATVHARHGQRRAEPRIWNDGKGTIIDL